MVHGVPLLCNLRISSLTKSGPEERRAACLVGPGCPGRSGPASAAATATTPLAPPAPAAPGVGPHGSVSRGHLAELGHLPHLLRCVTGFLRSLFCAGCVRRSLKASEKAPIRRNRSAGAGRRVRRDSS